MSETIDRWTAFDGPRLIAAGAPAEVAAAVRSASNSQSILVFNDEDGRQVDAGLRAPAWEVAPDVQPAQRGRGRPKLGVVAREVTLLPRHWEWLARQAGGASVALRKLVDEARKSGAGVDRRRAGQDAAYRVMLALAGDAPGYEEALRALYASDAGRFQERISAWPDDVRDYVTRLAGPAFGIQAAPPDSQAPRG